MKSAIVAFVMNVFRPLSTHPSPCFVALVRIDANIRPGLGLGEREGAHLRPLQCGDEVALLLLGRAERVDRIGAEVRRDRERGRDPGTDPGQFLAQDRLGQHGSRRAPDLFGIADAEEPGLAGFAEDLERSALGSASAPSTRGPISFSAKARTDWRKDSSSGPTSKSTTPFYVKTRRDSQLLVQEQPSCQV